MPAAIALHLRREIIQRRESGEAFIHIARRMRVSYEAVRQIYHRYVQTGRLAPAYERCRHTTLRSAPAVYEAAVALKRQHPAWGAGIIRVELAVQFADDQLPALRTLQRWFRRAQVQAPPRERAPSGTIRRGKTVHEVWAVDAKEQIDLADGSQVSWLTITDEASGAVLDTHLFPHQTLESTGSPPGERRSPGDLDPLGLSTTHPHG